MAWVGLVAKSIHIPSMLFWIQPATVWDIYYYYFTDYANSFKNCPTFMSKTFPPRKRLAKYGKELYFFLSKKVKYNDGAFQSIKDHIQLLNGEENPRVLLNTFDALEFDALKVLKNIVTMVGIGPSIPSVFLEGKDPSDSSLGPIYDRFQKITWIGWM
ncbi:hypothetical protein T459_19148 [Capsicum annuum]|uniref:Uncharacterized protein n=1 Tax=Capsicum annuum TaxID=4072 RepID=A0A2G2Z0V9_CAPAN|nr:hypothetical protein T459_19148 [Capsicum annuum]